MILGSYTVHFYCDHPNHDKWDERHNPRHWDGYCGEVVGRSMTECIKAIRRFGWLFTPDGKHYCPVCRKYPTATREVKEL